MRRTVLLLAATLLLAGCTSQAPTTSDDPLTPGDVKTGPDVGAISGIVVDASVTPVEGIEVTLQGKGLLTTTDVDGLFVFEDLEPGVYFMSFAGQDYDATQSSATVEAGKVAKLRVAVSYNPQPVPYHQTLDFQGYADAWIGIAGWAWDISVGEETGVYACGTCQFEFSVDADLQTIVMNPHFEHSVDPGPYHGSATYGYYMGLDWDGDFDRWYVDSGDTVHVQRSTFAETIDFEASMFPDDVWPGLQQEYTLYVTTFYIAPAPTDWSFFEQAP